MQKEQSARRVPVPSPESRHTSGVSEQLLGLFLPLGDLGECHCHGGSSQRFD
jgi:hypothetical protein